MNHAQRQVKMNSLLAELDTLAGTVPMPGISTQVRKDVFVLQLIDSIRRVEFFTNIRDKNFPVGVSDPTSNIFHPIKAAVYFKAHQDLDEACWLVFLSVFFGKNRTTGWEPCRKFYGKNNDANRWSWQNASANSTALANWLGSNSQILKPAFGNHRKYESLVPTSNAFAGHTLRAYIAWIAQAGSHQDKFNQVLNGSRGPGESFDRLYSSLGVLPRFGRMAIFDFLTSLGKLELLDIEPSNVYMACATGPRTGSNRLFFNQRNRKTSISELDGLLERLANNLSLGEMSMQVLEDAICNWDKNPDVYQMFRG